MNFYSAVQCSAVQCSAVQCSAVLYNIYIVYIYCIIVYKKITCTHYTEWHTDNHMVNDNNSWRKTKSNECLMSSWLARMLKLSKKWFILGWYLFTLVFIHCFGKYHPSILYQGWWVPNVDTYCCHSVIQYTL